MKSILALTLGSLLALIGGSASADDCAQKFVGDWMVRLNSGQTYLGHHLANGVMTADCPMCGSGTWTCQGNTIFKKAPWISYSGTLSADGNTITEPYGILTRIGPPPTINVNTPTVNTPTVNTPTTPTVNTPTVDTPTRPTVNTPTVDTPTTPTITTPPTSTVHTPTVTSPTTPTVHTPSVSGQSQKCADAQSRLKQFESGMGEQWVKDQLGKMGCS